jgi:hypothetical protein
MFTLNITIVKKFYIVGYVSPEPELSVFVSKRGNVGEQYLDEIAIFFSLDKAKEVAKEKSTLLPLNVYPVTFQKV